MRATWKLAFVPHIKLREKVTQGGTHWPKVASYKGRYKNLLQKGNREDIADPFFNFVYFVTLLLIFFFSKKEKKSTDILPTTWG